MSTDPTNQTTDTPDQTSLLWCPWRAPDADPALVSRLVRQGLLERCSGDVFVTPKGKQVRAGTVRNLP